MHTIMKNLLVAACAALMLLYITGCTSDDTGNGPVVPNGTRYNGAVFTNVTTTNDVVYGSNTTQAGNTINLTMDVYEPEGDTEAARPLVVLAHGGGFIGGDKGSVQELATYLAQSGYLVASISYRLVDFDPGANRAAAIGLGVIQAVHDMKAAIRYFVKDATEGNQYRANTNLVFLGGVSAGGFMALHTAYWNDNSELNALSAIDANIVTYVNNNGGIEGNSGNNTFTNYTIAGVMNAVGALIQADFVDAGEPPLISIHGTNDQVVPYLEGESDGSGVVTQGSGLIHPVADQAGVTNTLITVQGGDHGAFGTIHFSEVRQFFFNQLP